MTSSSEPWLKLSDVPGADWLHMKPKELREATTALDSLRPCRNPVFSGPPQLTTSLIGVQVQGTRIEICGYQIDVLKDGFPFQFLRWDGPDPVFWVIEETESGRYSIASAVAGTRTWFYANG